MVSKEYFTLEIAGVPCELEEALTHWLFEWGAGGVQEDLQFEQVERHYQPRVIEQDIKKLLAYFAAAPSPDVLEALKLKFPKVSIQTSRHQIRDWLEEWKQQWKPFSLVDDVWVVPDWYKDSFDSKNKTVLYIEPGMAFGTGTHDTTQIASQLLIELINQQKLNSALDVGTGSGILAFLASKKGVPVVYAYDNDSECKRVFHENCEKNSLRNLSWLEQWTQLEEPVDLTIANIIDGVLLTLKNEFRQVNSQFYIFTGILVEREGDFLAEMTKDWNLRTLKRSQQGEWVGLLMEKG